ncbi:MAG: haloacid dehalogenase-like hydrolase [Candidatus Nomurabacteria bacterium]|jgi:glycine cleavage system aminomethyltransferase T|nr:haloacid dehalogenase-like hydrolase [Candidatus Nomurabacteria bacterium]
MSEMLVLDFDKTLADTDGLFDVLCETAEQVEAGLGLELFEYNANRMAAGDQREMFRPDVVLGDRAVEVFATFSALVAGSDKEYIFEDAERLLKKVKDLGRAAVILTFGDEAWQRAKIEAILGSAGYDLPVVYTEEKIKSKVLEGAWSEERQVYELNSVSAGGIVGVGDERSDFVGYENLPNARGYIKNRRQLSDLPENVQSIGSLDEIELSA